MKPKSIKLFMDIAERCSQESHAQRLKVGCIIVKDQERIVSIGYNGTPPGFNNCCEIYHNPNNLAIIWDKYTEENKHLFKTKPEVIHAEKNAIAKLAKSTESGLGAIAFVTHAPCQPCGEALAGAGIETVYYKYDYRDTIGLDYLRSRGVQVIKVDENNKVESNERTNP